MKKVALMLMTLLLLFIPCTPALAQADRDTVKVKARQLASKLITDYDASGVQYVIRDHGAIVLSDSAGVSDKASKRPVAKDTMFGIGSLSKLYVTAAAMMLADAGQVDIDKPLTAYIKEFKMADERYKKITPRMLMNHSSGLYGSHYASGFLFNDNDTQNRDNLLNRLKSEILKADPGAFSVYCNDGFQLLEILVERVSGFRYNQFVKTFISKPLRLNVTKTPLDWFDRSKLAKTYAPGVDQALPVENVNLIGAGGIYSTAEEVSKVAEVLIGDRTDLLSKKSAQAMQKPEYRNGVWVSEDANLFNYGLGWDAVRFAPFSDYGITALFKIGDTQLYHSALIALPEYHISMIVLSSGGNSISNGTFASRVLLEYAKTKGMIQEILPDKTFEPALKAEVPASLAAYAGLYGAVGTTVHLEINNGEITMPALSGGLIPPQTYIHTGNGQFKNKEGNVTLSFDRAVNGVTYLKLDVYLQLPGLGQLHFVAHEYQKLEPNPLSQAVKTVWEHRNGKRYYALTEKITSVFYLKPASLTKDIILDAEHEYASGAKIVNINKAVNAATIPLMNGRDAFDLDFYQAHGKEYLTAGGQSYISEDAIPPFAQGNPAIRRVPSHGQAVWYKIDSESANRVLAVRPPAGGGFAVYDAQGALVNFSEVSNVYSTVLPEGGMIVFSGSAGDAFRIDLKNK